MKTDSHKKPYIIVTGGDAKYFFLIKDLLASIRALPEGRDAAVGVLDGGLEREQTDYLENNHVKVVKPEWPDEKSRKRANNREYLLINLNKPCLDKYFTDYEVIIWMDADTWVQTWEAVTVFLHVAGKGKLATVSRASRFQKFHISMRKKFFGWVEPRGILFKNAKRARLPSKLAWSLVRRPVLSAGAYALKQDAPHWETWRKWQKICLRKGRPFTTDQLSLALAVYEDNLPYEAIPERCNYIGPWRINHDEKMLVELYFPYTPISIIHIISKKSISDLHNQQWAGIDMNDNPQNIYLCYSSFGKNFIH